MTMSAPLSQADRAKGAILGALAADAATTPLHWIYDQAKLAELVKATAAAPEFFNPPSCPFYQVPVGSLSPYGAETDAMLRFAAANNLKASSALDGAAWAKALAGHFATVYSGYRNKSVKHVMAAVEAGKAYPETGDDKDTQANSLCKLPVVVAVYAGSERLPAAVEASIRAQQNNDTSVALGLAAARILEKVILGAPLADALAWGEAHLPAPAKEALAAAMAAKGEPFNAAATKLGVSCAMPGAFSGALLAAAGAGSYAEGVRTNMLAGGDNCSRSVYVGALLGAAFGARAVPADWAAKTAGWGEMEAAADKLVSA